ncbi:MAG: superoxide dismutase [Ni] [Planctomycetota bacterium]|jgi:nickel superoxide dismutase|nr:superoxide dismutase [Ni] [Planctomycetota bacterium]MDA1027130.1 superoxide dismutase [Ni] [Planctomycetota bacterium]
MKNTTLAGIVASTIAGGLLAVNVLDAAAPDVRSVIETARASVAASLSAHCEIPCGIYDDHAEVERMRLDARTIQKASAQIVALSKDVPISSNGAHLNTIARWAMIKEEHGRKLQNTVAWYFLAQRVKAPAAGSGDAAREKYHGQLAAFHRISVGAMKAAQNLDPAATEELLAAIEAIAPWYPANKGAGSAILPDDHLALDAAADSWRSNPGG